MKTEQPAPRYHLQHRQGVEATQGTHGQGVSDLQHDMAHPTGRASLGILDHIRVDYYGTPRRSIRLPTCSAEPSLITVQPWDVSQIGR